MCGFAGLIETSGENSPERLCTIAEEMAETIRHRGPDDAGVWGDASAGVALGFRRLAIIDLSAAGHQPFVSPDGRLVLVFNGEIYNHASLRKELDADQRIAWRGHSDTETLVACFASWGVRKTLERAVGMFALALWDRGERRLYLARDRFGEKPLYYGWTSNAFVFGSELRALRRYPRFDNEIDRDVLALYLQYAYVPAPYSIFRNVYKLDAGCVLSMTPCDAAAPPERALWPPARHRRIILDRYWSLSEVAERGLADPVRDEREATDRLEAALLDAVRLQSIADVPLGAFLSGGVDSSTIVALMQAQSRRRVNTYTIGFEQAGFNEAEHAKAVAQHLGTDHTELYVTARETLDVIPSLPDIYSEPFADSSQIPTHLVSRIARQHVTVALSGDGGDELFGGYVRYQWGTRVWNGVRRIPSPLRRGIAAGIQQLPLGAWDAVNQALPGPPRVARLGDKAQKLAHRLRDVATIEDLYRSLVTVWPSDIQVVPSAAPLPIRLDSMAGEAQFADPEHRMMLLDGVTYLPDDILHKVDRASMGVSLETRAPFLDHRVAELAWRLPLRMKIRDGKTKWAVRQVLYRHVPPELIERPKMGFGIPVESWLRGPLREWAEDHLDEARLRSQGYLDPAPILRKWEEHLTGARNWVADLWSVLMFQAWLERR